MLIRMYLYIYRTITEQHSHINNFIMLHHFGESKCLLVYFDGFTKILLDVCVYNIIRERKREKDIKIIYSARSLVNLRNVYKFI